MVEFNRSQNDGIGKVVQKFWSFIEKCGVVLVALKDEVFALSQLKAAAEIFRDSANKERGLHANLMDNPRQHRRGCSLAVGPSHHQNFFVMQEFVVENLRQGAKWDAFV